MNAIIYAILVVIAFCFIAYFTQSIVAATFFIVVAIIVGVVAFDEL